MGSCRSLAPSFRARPGLNLDPAGAGYASDWWPGAQPSGPPPKEEEGPAEAAPQTNAQEFTVGLAPEWPGEMIKSAPFFELHGYMRGRAYLFHNFNLGIPQSATGPSPPWFVPYTEYNATGDHTNPVNPASKAARTSSNGRYDNLNVGPDAAPPRTDH